MTLPAIINSIFLKTRKQSICSENHLSIEKEFFKRLNGQAVITFLFCVSVLIFVCNLHTISSTYITYYDHTSETQSCVR